jgi:hypothetical protein
VPVSTLQPLEVKTWFQRFLFQIKRVPLRGGKRDHRGFRHDSESVIQYPNGDRFFGPYDHGKRKGVVGLYSC